ncbi:flavin reductase family protein [Nocardioides sp. AE5]|uniref:flavin reductase family protein n=1 Tax=Nocardioides sp. AE5 TaxID=2962573 RepID=UPI002881DB5E|nr:flavin reductase family protein [Nocardioides sp. AE5]MDT0201216.1 flavin reductase family protein [Nocardioides sp. AE5]
MTIHKEHPFLEPEANRDPVRRLRGRLGGPVTLWTSGEDGSRAGLTVSSIMVAAGEPGRLIGLIDPHADLMDRLEETGRAVIQLLHYPHHNLADVFAGQVPAPGGMFAQASWSESEWGPVLDSVTSWAGVRLESATEVGWSNLVTTVIEHAVIGEEDDPLVHRRGRYLAPSRTRT